MSVDVGHRRRLAELFRREFPVRQFIITTHDGTWARQLKSVGLVSGKTSMVELFGWSVHSGPTLDDATDPFDRLRELLNNEDVPGAAHLLRRHSEAFFRGLAENLEAKVVFRGNGRWELQDFVSGVVSAYSTYLKLAVKHAKHYGSTDAEPDALEEAKQTFQQILHRAQVEQWAINDNVHYNNWPEFSVDDFRPVVEAFEDLYNVFICPRCGSEVHTVGDGKPEVLKCECGSKNFNLASA